MPKDNTKITKSRFPLYISLFIVLGIISSYLIISDVQQFFDTAWEVLTSNDEQRIKKWVSNFGWYGPLVLILAMVLQMFLIVIPTILLMVVSILAYGPIWGSLTILVAVFVASSVGYVIGNYFGQTFVLKLLGNKTETKIEEFIESFSFWAVVITRINPFLSNDAISFVAGILNMNYWKFIGATVMGILPLTILIAILGKTTENLESGLLIGSIVSLILFGIYYWKKNKK
ncbi:TVP38/TMEM64 family protein [Winogradskyella ouciana]|uniref:TVP38/TMEM64 family membrane protein n=1 Tax=Winogradskyella ouciana TaxID=2608631 RepID=A0A7K1GHH5_9FLAO|nr:TVP38/TMEM64 family protein [Winogradskyella ouciana]MTE28024.1 TVP38/TMEM64 family protein [Winogradskyella ouciana]